MPVETSTEVEELRGVQNDDGELDRPANESEQQKTNDRLGNQPKVEAFEYSTSSTDAEALPSNDVPEGVEVVVLYSPSNAGNVFVGNADDQVVPLTGVGQAVSYRVENTDAIHIRTPNASDGVGVTFEGGQ